MVDWYTGIVEILASSEDRLKIRSQYLSEVLHTIVVAGTHQSRVTPPANLPRSSLQRVSHSVGYRRGVRIIPRASCNAMLFLHSDSWS
jgi:hypothetical protein